MTKSDDTLHGACLCGAIVYRAAPPATNPSHCYCTMCQKSSGAAAGAFIDVARGGFVVERGSDMLVEYASSGEGRRAFCKVCGSSLYWRSEAAPGVIELSLGTLQPQWTGTVDREVHVDTKPSWAPHR
jgi:hypothetical protein